MYALSSIRKRVSILIEGNIQQTTHKAQYVCLFYAMTYSFYNYCIGVNIEDIDDMNKALSEIYKDLDSKSTQEDMNNLVNGQAIINETICTENIVGRWTWKS